MSGQPLHSAQAAPQPWEWAAPPPGAPPPGPEWPAGWPAPAGPEGYDFPPGMPVAGDCIPVAWGGMPPEAWGCSVPPAAAAATAGEAPADPQAAERWQWQQWQQWQQYEAAMAMQQQAMLAGAYQQAPLFAISPPGPHHRRGPPADGQQRLARKPKAALPAEPSYGCNSDGLEGGGSSSALLFSGEPSQAEVGEGEAGAAGGRPPRAHRRSHSSGGASPAGPRAGHARSYSGGAAAQPPLARQPSVAYDRAPRPVQWRPYTFADFQQRGYDAKASSKFWTLGGLGPAHGGSSFLGTPAAGSAGGAAAPQVMQGDAQWQAQQQKRERQLQFGQTVSSLGACGSGLVAALVSPCHAHCPLPTQPCQAVTHAMPCHAMPCHAMCCGAMRVPMPCPCPHVLMPMPMPCPAMPHPHAPQASQQNRARIAALPPRQRGAPPRPGAEVRERAIHFAQTGVPKPSSFRARGQPIMEAAAAAAVQAAQEGGSGAPAAVEPLAVQPRASGAAREAAPAVEDGSADALEAAGRLQAMHLDCAPPEAQPTDAAPGATGCSPEPPVGC